MRLLLLMLGALLLAALPAHAEQPLAPPPDQPCHATTGALPSPALRAVFADPFVYCAGGRFLVVASNWAGVHIPIAASADLSSWAVLSDERGHPLDAMPELPRWVLSARGTRPDVWAPEVAHLGGRWVLYFSARHAVAKTPAGNPRECIGTAVSDQPDRGFKPDPQPLVCGGFPEGVIDASLLHEGESGYLTFKSDGNCCHLPTTLYAAPLSPDGLRLAGAIRPINVSNDREWEGQVVEAPTMIRHGSHYLLFYSGGLFFTPSYGVGYAICEAPLGPCWKPEDNRVLQGREGWLIGPGHQSIFEADGRTFIAFHALAPGGTPGLDHQRLLHVEELFFDGDTPRALGPAAATPPAPAVASAPATR